MSAIFMNVQPLIGVLIARLSLAQGLGIAAILGGVWMTTRRAPAGERLHRQA